MPINDKLLILIIISMLSITCNTYCQNSSKGIAIKSTSTTKNTMAVNNSSNKKTALNKENNSDKLSEVTVSNGNEEELEVSDLIKKTPQDVEAKRIKAFKLKNVKSDFLYRCQGMTTDSKNLYIAIVEKKNNKDCDTIIVKFNIASSEIVAEKSVGQIGHSNSLTYNEKTNKIYTAPLEKGVGLIYEFDTNLENIKQVYLKSKNKVFSKNKKLISVTYDKRASQYLAKIDDFNMEVYDNNFNYLKTIKVTKRMNIAKGMTSQAVSTDLQNWYSVCNDLTKKENRNRILIYNNDFKFQREIKFSQDTSGKFIPELQQITFVKDKCYGVSRVGKEFVVYELNFNK